LLFAWQRLEMGGVKKFDYETRQNRSAPKSDAIPNCIRSGTEADPQPFSLHTFDSVSGSALSPSLRCFLSGMAIASHRNRNHRIEPFFPKKIASTNRICYRISKFNKNNLRLLRLFRFLINCLRYFTWL